MCRCIFRSRLRVQTGPPELQGYRRGRDANTFAPIPRIALRGEDAYSAFFSSSKVAESLIRFRFAGRVEMSFFTAFIRWGSRKTR